MVRSAVGSVLALAVAASSPAQAAEPTTTTTTRTVWYGWQTLAADGVSASLIVVGASQSTALLVMGLIGYELGAPTVHWAHLQLGRGLASLGCRMLLPSVGAIVGGVVTTGNTDFNDVRGPIFGALIGMIFPVALDAAGLAYEKKVETRTTAKPDEPRPLFTVAPQLSVGAGRGSVGLAGTF